MHGAGTLQAELERQHTFSTGRRMVSAEISWQSSSSSAIYRRLSPFGLTVQLGSTLREAVGEAAKLQRST